MKRLLLSVIIASFFYCGHAQPVPAEDENIPFLVTFGSKGSKSWGDDDFCQIFFFSIPSNHTTPIFIRVFDPDVGGKHDENKSGWNSKTKFSVYGGKGALSANDEQNKDPVAGFDSGNLLASKTFGSEATYDGKWYTFGPFNPAEGDNKPALGGRIFKMIANGIAGDDGNLYRYYLSTKPNENTKVEGANAFTYEYTFRLHGENQSISHIYPYIDKNTIAVKQHNFDFDNDAYIRIVSVAKKGLRVTTSGESDWKFSQHDVVEEEKNGSLDVQIIKTGSKRNNNVVFYITNQYGKFMPFFTIPIGGVPKYNYQIGVRKKG